LLVQTLEYLLNGFVLQSFLNVACFDAHDLIQRLSTAAAITLVSDYHGPQLRVHDDEVAGEAAEEAARVINQVQRPQVQKVELKHVDQVIVCYE
jgi:hypothetical protein